MPKVSDKNFKQLAKDSATWQDVIRDAEAEIAKAQTRIRRLEGVIRTCQRKQDSGEPFPYEPVNE